MKFKAWALLAAPLFCLMGTAHAQVDAGKDALYIKSLAATCANCHGTNCKAVDGSSVGSLAGLAYAGEGRVMAELVDLDELIRELLDLLQASVAQHCTLEYVSAGPLPRIRADPLARPGRQQLRFPP